MATSPVRVRSLPVTGRVTRRPQHPFYIYARPFEITPMFLAPVLPGESLTNLLLQARVITDPIINPIQGWWQEYYFFYVKLRDLEERDDYTAMHLEPSYDLTAHDQESAADPWRYTAIGGQKFVASCLTRVVDEYFRDQGEVAADRVISTGRPAAKINGESWTNSLIPASELATLDVDVSADMDIDAEGVITDPLMASEIDQSMRHYEFLKANGLVQMDYEDYLQTFGIRVAEREMHRPELVRYVREWSYPANTIDPSDGSPTSAVSWSIAERADKKRFFAEPGFLFGVSLTRPKLLLKNQVGLLAAHLDNAFSWLPALMSDDPATSLRQFDDTTGPVPTITVDSVVDMRDLFMYGEQFINHPAASSDANFATLPATNALNDRYPTEADVDALFVTVETGTSGLDRYRVRMDGIVSFSILGRQVDTSPRSMAGIIV